MVGVRVYDRIKGWGNIIDETEHFYIIRWDSDPWYPETIIKRGN